MRVPNQTSRRYFTKAARTAALQVRREKAVAKEDLTRPALFVVRQTPSSQRFGWEIRRFGGVLLSRSEAGYDTQSQAQTAGARTLAAMVRP